MAKLCNQTYTDEETGTVRKCQDGNPRPAAYVKAGVYVCRDCWPDLVAGFTKVFGKTTAQAMGIAFRKV